VVPSGIGAIQADVYGGDGGDVSMYGVGGTGAGVHAVVPVTPGETLTVYVGGKGSLSGGFNGGGAAGGSDPAWSSGGGGASEIRRGSTSLAIAGGGGGGSFAGPGGAGHGLDGVVALVDSSAGGAGGGGTLFAGGPGGSGGCGHPNGQAGTRGQGGAGGGASGWPAASAGGGGGGYYGGGGGGAGCRYGGPGGGGSSYLIPSGTSVSAPGETSPLPAENGSVTITPVAGPQTVSDIANNVLSPIRPPESPSDGCMAPSATVMDGYFGSLYARLRTQGAGTSTWVCARLQSEGGTEYAGGKFAVSDPTSTLVADDKYGLCSSQSDNTLMSLSHPIRSGAVGGVPYLLDAYANTQGAAWLCLQAGLGARVGLNGTGAVFQQDDPAAAVSPPRTPWTPGKASTDCETQVGGTKTQLVNAVIDGTQVWLDSWQSGSKIELCVRAAGASTAGGRLVLDATGGPGVTPVLTLGGTCGSNVFRDDQDQVEVTRSDSVNPASVCITKGSTSIAYTIGFTGNPSVPLPTWTADG
jgi:hypothetical protein